MRIAGRLATRITSIWATATNTFPTAARNRWLNLTGIYNLHPVASFGIMNTHCRQTARTTVAHNRLGPELIAARSPAQCRRKAGLQQGRINRRELNFWPSIIFKASEQLPATVARSYSSSSSASPPPAEIEATCLRCIVSAISGDLAEELGDVLLAMGAQSVVVQEHRPPGAPEQEIFDDGEARLWDCCDLVVHFPLEADVEGTLAVALDALDLSAEEGLPGGFRVEAVANEAWVEQIKASYVPLRIAEDLWVIPEWSEPEDPAATNIVLQPGVAFGTGEHPTTRLCLRELRAMGARGELTGAAVCDYGTGSGVLALAALKYGAARAVGTDIDSLAVKAAQRNGALNGFHPPTFTAVQCGGGIDEPEPLTAARVEAAEAGAEAEGAAGPGSATSDDGGGGGGGGSPAGGGGGGGGGVPQFDLVVANILRGPLVELQPRLAGYVRPGGRLMLSGILYEQTAEIQQAYGRDFEGFTVATDQQWALLQATKRRGKE
ncbi:hypothetical protein PLESTB_000579800 [Pleodorina starrii]|uniref:ETFB lysine methyltransferase n=1 Tax=Pleodorina starrii TaxID=330485 RepID=A0A9W6BHV3_9CHLO|nr:hypothetical protein PLESTM_000304700 [Pleodorina starrii]GLC52073.1 hypothetical protein PLESTB_000579800 [Pleodorina starrii]GLC72216.1 hypothetical protein PLESTF_001220000 [Pleodorina starrii]